MQLLTDEKVLKKYGQVTLTNYRIRKIDGWNEQMERARELVSIRLEQVTHCKIVTHHNPLLIALAVLSFVLGLLLAGQTKGLSLILGLGVALLLVIAYIANRYNETEVASSTTRIRFRISGHNSKDAIDFVNSLEGALNQLTTVRTSGPVNDSVIEPQLSVKAVSKVNGDLGYWGG